MNKLISRGLCSVVLLSLCACGKIPSQYQGGFVDAKSGTKMVLNSGDATMTETSGRVVTDKANALDFDSLDKMQDGIYTRAMQGDDKELEIFWIVPNAATRQESNGFVWTSAEILYTRMRTDLKDPVQEIDMLHCTDGTLMLDEPTKTWNGGCPADAAQLDFKRQSS